MKRHFVAMFAFVACALGVLAQNFPTVSTPENTVWYLIQFVNGGNAITAETSGVNITTAATVGSAAQLWKVEGTEADGYQLTNKKGYTIHVASAAKNEMVQASASASGVSRFVFTKSGDNFEIHPKSNTAISMNLWGGPNENRGVGLWDKGDQNNVVKFVDASDFDALGKISLIPYPQELTEGEGSFDFAKLTAIAYGSDEMQAHVERFAAQLELSSGIELDVKKAAATATAGEVWFGADASLPRDGYTLEVKENGIEIKTSSYGGELYALQTLMQLLPREFFATEECDVEWTIPVVTIKDNPQFEHRGFMMDVARHFFDKDEVKKVLDIMAFYKLNRFHWHLTDDQGWRIEIPEYPKLTEVGAIRAGSFTNNGDGQKFFDDTEYGRGLYFTLDDLREIVAYAAERNIDILPEIDLPGHMVAAVASYPEFSCDPTKKYEVRIDGGISHDVLNVGKDEVIDFLKCVLGHVAEVFPFPYIHLGGDECPTEQWATNADCLRRVQEEGLAGVQELQSWLVEKLGTYLKTEYGKDIVVWDEVLANWNTKNTTTPVIMAWNQSGALSKKAADLGFNSILCPYSHVYIDFPQVPENQMFIDEPYYGGWGTNSVERVYSLNPVAYLSGQEEFCWGAQANLWAETLNDNEELEYCLLPRILALAEVGWLPVEKKNWVSFYRRLQSHDEILDQLGYTYAKHYIEPKEYTATEQAIMEAEEILAASIRGGVGYPAAENYGALQEVLEAAKTSSLNTDALTEAIAAYKAAPLVQPEAGKTYRILSASTYFKRQYEGSSMYQKGSGVNFHYTPQTEPEELWQFTPSGDGYILTNCYSGAQLTMNTYNAAVTMTDKGTPIRMDKATIEAGGYTYIPGVVTLSAVEGYSATVTGSVKRLSAELSGQVYAKDEARLCYNGTWRIEEVTDYTAWLEGLVEKCEHIILTAKPGEVNQPTAEALEYLNAEVIAPAKELLTKGNVNEEQYDACVAKYLLFQQMERTGISQTLDEGYYYHLRNVWFGKYAAYNSSSKTINHQSSKSNSDNYLWRVVKQPGGSIYLINKATGTAAYPTSYNGDQAIKLGQNYEWTLEERNLDGKTGICIIDKAGENSWYTNPDVWAYVILKPFWGACTWEFQKTDIAVSDDNTQPEQPVTPQAGIFPQPQQVQWGSEKAFDNTVAYNLVGAATADADAVALINKHFTTENGTINLTIGERGDAAVAAYESLIPAKAEGYYLSVTKDGVVIAGNDTVGTYYGVQTYLQVAARAEVKTVTITDWPTVGDRGLVEGYYGNPYSDADRKSLLEFFGRTKMNVYIYGPKDDPYHRDKWRWEYPAEDAARISELAATAAKHKVRFVWAMHPGLDIQWTDADRKASINKLEKMYALGVRAFAIFFDDIEGSEQRNGANQAAYLNYLNDNFVKKHADVAPLILCPTEYCRSYVGGGSTYLDDLGNTLAPETHVMWTGAGVVDMINKSDMDYVNGRIKRNAYIWLNYPVNDYCRDHILMGPTYGNDLDIASMLGGFVSNPMEYAEASKVSLYSIGDYCWNMEGYDADASWESALQSIMPSHTEAFRLFCENNVDLGAGNAHGLRRTNESPRFVEALDEYNSLMEQGNATAAIAKLNEHFTLMANAATELMQSSENHALVTEITPWCQVMEYIALKGQELMKMREALIDAKPEDFIASYERYQQYNEEQDAIRSRDFEGSIRTARPGVAVAAVHIQPFLKSELGILVAEYRANYDFGLDKFPAQEVENGNYFIMYDGQYLTDQAGGAVPSFVSKRNDVEPQRQEWNISLDGSTGRYKIVCRQGERYLNEKGEFTANNTTNPYEAAWHTYNIMRLANGKYCIQNAGSAGNNAWTVNSSRIVKSNEGVEPKYFIFDLVPVSGTIAEAPIVSTRDVYYIMDGDRYLTNSNPGGTGGTPTFKSVATPGDAQEWRITIDGAGKNHYKITSDADGRYINEQGVFGTNDYYPDWNTYLILTMDDMCAVQTTQSAAKNGARFWNIKNDRLEQDGELTRQNAYVIKIVAKGEVTGPDPEPGMLKQFTVNGSIDGPNNTALPSKVMPGVALDVVLRGAPGYAAKGLTVRYGINPNGKEFDAEGNRQWTEQYVAATNGKATIPAEMIEGDVNLYATFEHDANSEWYLVFSDEFSGADKSQPTADKWMRCQRYNATWNRWLSDSEEVIYLEDGNLVARAIPNPDKANDPVDMITGGIKSMGKFGFTYGYVEARIYNNLWIGNFPAFWMMPEDQSLGWPDCGEIDIWEVIDTQNKSYHTIHSNWTYDLHNTGNPQSSFNTSCSYDRYHTFGLAWDATSLIWYLDGKEVGRYTKSTNQSALDQGQWPFDKHFHLILNQSVGNNAWAANADITHTYETRFDWVRVYQKLGMKNTDGIVDAIDIVEQDAPESDAIYTLQGVRMNGPVESLPQGLYIVGGKKVLVK